MLNLTVGQLIEAHRKAAGHGSQAALSRASGLGLRAVRSIEKGDRSPTVAEAVSICDVCPGLTVAMIEAAERARVTA